MKIKEETEELKSLINATSSTSDAVSKELGSSSLPTELEDPEPIFEIDYSKEMKEAKGKAKASIKVLVSSIVSKDFLNSSYIKDKINQDAEQLGKLFYQQRMIEIMQEANMNSVGKGNVSARMIEVFTLLSKNHSDISKQISDFQTSIRKSYIDIVLDLKEKEREDNSNKNNQKAIEEKNPAKNIFIGSDLTKILQEKKKEKYYKENNIENVEFLEV